MELVVPYEDEHLLIVDKPAGLVVHPAPGHAQGTLVHGLLAYDVEGGDEPERPGIVHRLDRDTSGLMVVARSPEAHRRLQEMVQARELTREYLALVVGRPRSRRGTIEAPIGRDRNDALRHSLDTDTPRDAVTHFEVEELLPTARAAPRAAGNGADAPDPRASGGDRPSGGGRPAVRSRRPRPRAAVPPCRAARLPPSVHGRGGRRELGATDRSWSRPRGGESSVEPFATRVPLGALAVVRLCVERGIGDRTEDRARARKLGAIHMVFRIPEIGPDEGLGAGASVRRGCARSRQDRRAAIRRGLRPAWLWRRRRTATARRIPASGRSAGRRPSPQPGPWARRSAPAGEARPGPARPVEHTNGYPFACKPSRLPGGSTANAGAGP